MLYIFQLTLVVCQRLFVGSDIVLSNILLLEIAESLTNAGERFEHGQRGLFCPMFGLDNFSALSSFSVTKYILTKSTQ